MGAWGSGPFANDGAGDLIASMRHGDFSFEGLSGAYDDEYLEVDAGQYAIALVTIALIALGKHSPVAALEGVDLDAVRKLFTTDRLAWIVKIADRVLEGSDSSELYELWEEADQLTDWRNPAIEAVNLLRAEINKL